ncbi:uncharacterized protein LOC124124539 [Haliotis rufescens]|uniref:uncharacterized protein LOC124124539 n=1 Tax=Haliotis rufescens TaxID=6454 RepID=UPI00201FAC8A|nr:uncharacterized protein LOC124124539 [Haliotis rufescens]XP_046343687.2 uncharacterized protein LOC124124539 [Haliotis rufescens]XP_048253524.1 uncharacterized protein LOC124124539 [Haliotis rufescens]
MNNRGVLPGTNDSGKPQVHPLYNSHNIKLYSHFIPVYVQHPWPTNLELVEQEPSQVSTSRTSLHGSIQQTKVVAHVRNNSVPREKPRDHTQRNDCPPPAAHGVLHCQDEQGTKVVAHVQNSSVPREKPRDHTQRNDCPTPAAHGVLHCQDEQGTAETALGLKASASDDVTSQPETNTKQECERLKDFQTPCINKGQDMDTERSSKTERPLNRKQDKQAMVPKTVRMSIPLIAMKPCKLLHRGHVPYSVIVRTTRRPSGVYKIAYKWETVYVSSPTSNIIKELRKQFSGDGKQEIVKFLLNLTKEELEMVSVFWLNESIHVHHCGRSYLECIKDLQGKKPMLNDIQPILCSMTNAGVTVINNDSKTSKDDREQSQHVSILPSHHIEDADRYSPLDDHSAPTFSLMPRKRPACDDGEKSQFHTDAKKIKYDQHGQLSRHLPTKSPKDIPICRRQTTLSSSATVPSTVMNLNMKITEMSLSNVSTIPALAVSSGQRSQPIRASEDKSMNLQNFHENQTTHDVLQQLGISPRSPEFEARTENDNMWKVTGHAVPTNIIRKDKRVDATLSTVTKEYQPACPTTIQVNKYSPKKLQRQSIRRKCKSPSKETLRDHSTVLGKHSQTGSPCFEPSSAEKGQKHTVGSAHSQHTKITPRYELMQPEKRTRGNVYSDQEQKVSTTSGNDPTKNKKMTPVSSESISDNSFANKPSVITPNAVNQKPELNVSKLLERMLKAAPTQQNPPNFLGQTKTPGEGRSCKTKNPQYKGRGSHTGKTLVCESIVSSTQTYSSIQHSQTKVRNKTSGETRKIRARQLLKKGTDSTQGVGVFSVLKTFGSKVLNMMNPFVTPNDGQ